MLRVCLQILGVFALLLAIRHSCGKIAVVVGGLWHGMASAICKLRMIFIFAVVANCNTKIRTPNKKTIKKLTAILHLRYRI